MTMAEREKFLAACLEECPDYHPLFFTALRAGLRKGELIALQWGDIQLGASEDDREKFILVRRNYYMGEFGTPKNHEYRRVDMTKQLRAVLAEWKDRALVRAYQVGKASIAEDLVFPSEERTPISADNIVPRYMEPTLERAGLRRFRFHDLRHTFGSLMIQKGVSPAYVQKQMGHKSIQVTIDIYGHLIPGANSEWIDVLDETAPAESAPPAHTKEKEEVEGAISDSKDWLPPRDSNPDMLIQRQEIYDSAEFLRFD
jgi:integrase